MHKTLIGVLISVGVLSAAAGSGYYFYNQGKATVQTPPSTTTTQTCNGTPVIASFTSSVAEITSGGSVTLSWEVTNADYVEIDNGVGKVEAKGSIEVKPTALTTYNITVICGPNSLKSSVLIKTTETVVDPYAGWKTYRSKIEKATFKYPQGWQKVDLSKSTQPGYDSFGLKSPLGNVRVSWITGIDGLGGGCDKKPVKDGGCPEITVLKYKAIAGAKGLYVVRSITYYENDEGKLVYAPWIAVLENKYGYLKNRTSLPYDEYQGRQKNSYLILFSTSGIEAFGPPAFSTYSEATAWFSKSDVQDAEKMMKSLKY